MSERVVVIGSNSFSGAHFVHRVLEANMDVISMSRSPEPDQVFLPYEKSCSGYRFYQLDLNFDLDDIIDTIKHFEPQYIVNFASQSMVAESWQNPDHWFQTNVVATIKLHERLRNFSFLKKYVHISTPEVYGSCEGLVPESYDYNPSTPYAVSRAAADMSLMTYFKTYHFPVVITRAANVFGPCQQLYRIIPRAILFFLIGNKLQLHGGGHSVRSFIDIRDVAEGTLRVMRNAPPGEIYHFSTMENISIRSLVKMVAEIMGIDFEKNVVTVGERLGKDAAYLLDSSKAREELGWKDRFTLKSGIEDTFAWIKNSLDTLKLQSFDYIHKP